MDFLSCKRETWKRNKSFMFPEKGLTQQTRQLMLENAKKTPSVRLNHLCNAILKNKKGSK
jgi:hypothetical protein